MPAPRARAGRMVLLAWPGVTSTRTVCAEAGAEGARRTRRGVRRGTHMGGASYPRQRPSRNGRTPVGADAVELLHIAGGAVAAGREGQLHPDVPVAREAVR